jgi:membrane protein required for colicin V production
VNVDLFVLGLVALFAIIGAFSGAARQIARLIAAIVAGILARVAGPHLSPLVSQQFQCSRTTGTVIASLGLFLIGFLVIRWAVNEVLLRILAGKNAEDRGLDRMLGFFLGGLRVGAMAWFVLCAVSFLEDNVSIAGRKLSLVPENSVLFTLARQHNLFAMASSAPGLQQLIDVAKAASDPKQLDTLKKNPAYATLRRDQRFRSVLDTDSVKRALENDDYRALLQNTDVMRLLSDPNALKAIEDAATSAEK